MILSYINVKMLMKRIFNTNPKKCLSRTSRILASVGEIKQQSNATDAMK